MLSLTLGNGMAVTKNRKGRKRKTVARREPNGRAQRVNIDYRGMAALTPHRIPLPVAYRLDERAESYLGRLNIVWRTSGLPRANRPGIPDEEYEAGRRYQKTVHAYLALANAPRLAQLRVIAEASFDPESMPTDQVFRRNDPEGIALTQRYMDAYEAVSESAGREDNNRHKALRRAVHDEPCAPDQIIHLREALHSLAVFYGLTNHGKSNVK
jgi:hypothetical protein